MQVAQTILEQLGGYRFIAMTGAKNLVAEETSLTFKLPKCQKGINAVKITLDPSDTYTMTFYAQKRAPSAVSVISEHQDVYFDMLQSLFTNETGLYTSL